ncbi:beta-ketoacyl-ACP synthase 3 [Dyella sp. 2RAB6]|uniref:beta-ketoacyl-ACP synthase 3 n=1 Tax=Dyella sp. 2RAB6 TaxID=3232992 RepID=UPI003F9377FC
MLSVEILGTGEYLPSQCIPSSLFDERWGKPSDWTWQRAGIERRYYATEEETTSVMAARAAQSALDAARIDAAQLDCIVSACSVMEQAIPCSATLIQRQLGLGESGIPAFDINATCLSFLAALDTMSVAIAAGRYRRVLIVSSEIASAGLREDDMETSVMFGDGAGAVVLGPSQGGACIKATHYETYAAGAELCQVRAGGTRIRVRKHLQDFLDGSYFEMHGRRTYRMAAQKLPAFLERLFARSGVSPDAVDRIIPHQASAKALAHIESLLQLQPGKMVKVLATRGNQMSASIPVTLHHAVTTGEVKRGDTVLLLGSGAGLSLGGAVLTY